jgi:hypothetical protein
MKEAATGDPGVVVHQVARLGTCEEGGASAKVPPARPRLDGLRADQVGGRSQRSAKETNGRALRSVFVLAGRGALEPS